MEKTPESAWLAGESLLFVSRGDSFPSTDAVSLILGEYVRFPVNANAWSIRSPAPTVESSFAPSILTISKEAAVFS
jgi:hypothetical protein